MAQPRSPSSPSSSSPPATAASSPCSTARTSSSPSPARSTIANFLEASRAVGKGPYDLVLVEGSITTPHDAERIHQIRRRRSSSSRSAPARRPGGIQALRNFADVHDYAKAVYASPAVHRGLGKSTPIRDHVFVDFELRGCPITKAQLLEVVSAFLAGRKPVSPASSVCLECKRRGTPCVMVARGSLPRTRDAGGLRRALPVVRPRLLRLLRADGDRRTPRRSPRSGRAGRRRPRASCARSARSTRAPRRSARRASSMRE